MKLDRVARAILLCRANGSDLTTIVSQLKRSRSSLQTEKKRLAKVIREFLGQEILVDVQSKPGWRDSITARREAMACRLDRAVGA